MRDVYLEDRGRIELGKRVEMGLTVKKERKGFCLLTDFYPRSIWQTIGTKGEQTTLEIRVLCAPLFLSLSRARNSGSKSRAYALDKKTVLVFAKQPFLEAFVLTLGFRFRQRAFHWERRVGDWFIGEYFSPGQSALISKRRERATVKGFWLRMLLLLARKLCGENPKRRGKVGVFKILWPYRSIYGCPEKLKPWKCGREL